MLVKHAFDKCINRSFAVHNIPTTEQHNISVVSVGLSIVRQSVRIGVVIGKRIREAIYLSSITKCYSCLQNFYCSLAGLCFLMTILNVERSC